jgi:hypothetical protein
MPALLTSMPDRQRVLLRPFTRRASRRRGPWTASRDPTRPGVFLQRGLGVGMGVAGQSVPHMAWCITHGRSTTSRVSTGGIERNVRRACIRLLRVQPRQPRPCSSGRRRPAQVKICSKIPGRFRVIDRSRLGIGTQTSRTGPSAVERDLYQPAPGEELPLDVHTVHFNPGALRHSDIHDCG